MAKTSNLKVNVEFGAPAPEGRQIKSRVIKFSKTYDEKGKILGEEWTEEVTFEDAPVPKVAVQKLVEGKWQAIGSTDEGTTFHYQPDDKAINYATGGLISQHASGSAIDMNHITVNAGKLYSAPLEDLPQKSYKIN
jgi:hypothetical protein